jgi:tetratricopeptide (TPR) repeat protein
MDVKFSQAVMLAVVTFIVTGAAFCIESPIGSPTTPATSTQSGLIPSTRGRNINVGNDIVTGNVTGGKQFQGIVPYGSFYYFQGTQGAGVSDVESFLRRTAGTAYSSNNSPGAIQPYYSPYQSVSSLQSRIPDNYSIASSSAFQLPRMSPYKQPQTYGLVPLEEAQTLQKQNEPPSTFLFQPQTTELPEAPLTYGNYRPLSSTPLEMEQYISEQIKGKLYPTEQQAEQPSPLPNAPQIVQPKENALELTKKPSEPVEPSTAFEPTQPGPRAKLPSREIAKAPGVFEQMVQKVRDDFQKTLEQMTAKQGLAQAEVNQPAEANQPVSPKAIIGYSRTFATQERTRFNDLMKGGEQYIKDKEYYKAADAYALAAVYQRNNPLPYAGRAFALLGAGEYMSSAYFLTRAINLFPDYVRFRVDLGSMFGDKDMLEKRVADIAAWQERTNSPELQFLLAYIYFQTDRLELAQRMTNGALVQMPQSTALQVLDKVIRLDIEQAKETGKP